MRRCRECNGIAQAYSEQRGTFFGDAIAYVKCRTCGRHTNIHSAFYTSDASNEARKEWDEMNRI